MSRALEWLHDYLVTVCDGVSLPTRHLSLSQMVSLSIVSAGDAVDRAHTLRRFIELAFILQSGTYGNLFSFISIMQGLTSPQVSHIPS